MSITAKQRLSKYMTDNTTYSMSFANILATGEVINSATVSSSPVGLTLETPTYDSNSVYVRASGGSDGVLYSLLFTITTDCSNTFTGRGLLLVNDR